MKKLTLNLTRQQVYDSLAFSSDSGSGRSALMRSEREAYNFENGDVSNGFRSRRAHAEGRTFELQVPRTRYGNFKPVLLSVLKDQDEEMHRLCHSLYTKGLRWSGKTGQRMGVSSISNKFQNEKKIQH